MYSLTLPSSLEIQSLGVLFGLNSALNLRMVNLSIMVLLLNFPLIRISTLMIRRFKIIASLGSFEEPVSIKAFIDDLLFRVDKAIQEPIL